MTSTGTGTTGTGTGAATATATATATSTTTTEGEVPASDTEFESYLDRESGSWSLRRIPSSPPPPSGAEPDAGRREG